ncbi:MAG: hypothetical protein Q9163_002354 [Psora crenata]
MGETTFGFSERIYIVERTLPEEYSRAGRSSPWNTLRQDEELRAEIFQDVERCMPENAYFREPSTQGMLLEILFVYCKLNHDIGYRQGMHEVLAPILWVVSCDAINPKDCQRGGPESDDLMLTSLDANYIEHDAFTLFGIIMQTVKTFYELGNSNEPPTTGVLHISPIVERSKRIHENYLHHADPELAEHLAAIEILPQIFLIRWVRLLFGREFPFEDVLALWDTLFAEDPTLDLVDLICVSMLLRIRWQLLEADYTAALTLLLRYPVPQPPHGPSTFVSDALYLRDNLLLDGGDHIISKYSHKSPETTVTRKLPKKVRRARVGDKEGAQRAMAPSMPPSRLLLQEQGGIEHMIQEAAKGVYNRGEKWGVAKALRGAVQGLQSANASPRPALERSHWSLDSGRIAPEGQSPDLVAKIRALEERNKALAKMLETAMNEMWSRQNHVEANTSTDNGSDALSLAIVKVQFVQVYLENPSMPLPADMLSATQHEKGFPPNGLHSPPAEDRLPPHVAIDEPISEKPLPVRTKPKLPRSPGKSSPSPSQPTTPCKPSHRTRPSLTQASYSWMLGEEQPKSGFVAASPLAASAAGRGRTDRLFGEGDKAKAPQAEEEDDVFSDIVKRGRPG